MRVKRGVGVSEGRGVVSFGVVVCCGCGVRDRRKKFIFFTFKVLSWYFRVGGYVIGLEF